MEQSIHTKLKGGLQKSKDKSKTSEKIAVQPAIYLKDFEILLNFTNGEQRIFNLCPCFQNYREHTPNLAFLPISKSIL